MGTRPRGRSDLLFQGAWPLQLAVDCYNQPPIFLRHRSPDRRVQVSRGELLGSLQVPFCRFGLAYLNLSLFWFMSPVVRVWLSEWHRWKWAVRWNNKPSLHSGISMFFFNWHISLILCSLLMVNSDFLQNRPTSHGCNFAPTEPISKFLVPKMSSSSWNARK